MKLNKKSFPTQVVVMGGGQTPGFGDFNPVFLLHAEQHITLHQTLPSAGKGIATARVGNIYDRKSSSCLFEK